MVVVRGVLYQGATALLLILSVIPRKKKKKIKRKGI